MVVLQSGVNAEMRAYPLNRSGSERVQRPRNVLYCLQSTSNVVLRLRK